MLRPEFTRYTFWTALTLIGLAACGTSVAVGPLATAQPADLAFVEAVIDQTSGTQPATRNVVTFRLADGSLIGCGDWTAPDGIGTTQWAPFYVRWRGSALLRIHLDDTTGFGPALQGCNMARAGRIKISG